MQNDTIFFYMKQMQMISEMKSKIFAFKEKTMFIKLVDSI